MKNLQQLKVKNFSQHWLDLFELYPQKALLILLYNNQCLGCTGRAIPFANQMRENYKQVQVIGIHVNFSQTVITSREEILSIFTVNELPFPIFLDEEAKIYHHFQAEGTPQWLIFDKKHQLYRSIFGSQGNAQNRVIYALEELHSD